MGEVAADMLRDQMDLDFSQKSQVLRDVGNKVPREDIGVLDNRGFLH
jgi:hypothetical protein